MKTKVHVEFFELGQERLQLGFYFLKDLEGRSKLLKIEGLRHPFSVKYQ